MSGAWRYRVGKDESGTLHFVFVRYDTVEHQPNGAVGILNEGRTLGDMIGLADALLAACKEPVIDLIRRVRRGDLTSAGPLQKQNSFDLSEQ